MKICRLALIAALALAASAARAADGTIDLLIDPAAGAAISVPGSYRLVDDVTMTANVAAINITVADVTLDLGNHKITAAAGSTFDGILSNSPGLVVMNGAVAGFGGGGVVAFGVRSVVRNMRVTGCNQLGSSAAIRVGAESVVEGCIASANNAVSGAVQGISAGSQCRIAGNIVQGNTSSFGAATGIVASTDCVIADNVVSGNSGVSSGDCIGINAGNRCSIRGNTVSDNDNTGTGDALGIDATAGCIVERNSCGAQSTGTTGIGVAIGIEASQCTVIGNNCFNNDAGAGSNGSGVGISATGGCTVRDNYCEGNGGTGTGASNGIMVSIGATVVGNTCRQNLGGAASHGIRVAGSNNLVAGNSTTGHTDGGIIFLSSTSNRCHSNQCDEAEIIESTAPGVAPSSNVTAGDLANVLF